MLWRRLDVQRKNFIFLDVDPKPLQVEWDRTAVVGNDEKRRSGLDDEELNLISSEFDEMPIELRPVVA